MTAHTWIRRLFTQAPRTARRAPASRRPTLRALEGRELPATGLSLWSPLAQNDQAWAREAAVWTPQALSAVAGTSENAPRLAMPLTLNEAAARSALDGVPAIESGSPGRVIALPDPKGELQRFHVWEVPTMEPGLAARFPDITTYRGQGIDDPSALLAADFTPLGFRARVFSQAGYSIAPVQTVSDGQYTAFFAADDVVPHGTGCGCGLCQGAVAAATSLPTGAQPPSGGLSLMTSFGTNLRTFRLAVAATGEYSFLTGSNVSWTLSAIVSNVNSVNTVYLRDCGLNMILVANNDQIIYTNLFTDPYTGNNLTALLTENQIVLDTVIGSANYDIGHVYTADSSLGGLASQGVVGQPTTKARGASACNDSNPTGNWMKFVTAHEIGHQFGAGHTFNGVSPILTSNRSAFSAWEPGAGDTIMAYPHITENNQAYSNLYQFYFHAGSIGQIDNYLSFIPAVGTTTPTGNKLPVVNAGPDRVIPANTPFQLSMSATDPDGDPLFLGFDQMDTGPALSLGFPDNGSSPLFRSYFPTFGAFTRTMPWLNFIVLNQTYAPETMPSTNRNMTFRAIARDAKLFGGAVVTDDVTYKVVNTGSPFAVTSPNIPVAFFGNTPQTVTWNVAGTTANGINTAQVRILMSYDGGLTYPTTLAAATANDGSETVIIPNDSTTAGRIKIEAVGNTFYDISDSPFTVVGFPGVFVVTNPADSGPGSLRHVLAQANVIAGVDTVTFNLPGGATINLASELLLTEGVVVRGPDTRDVTISGGNQTRLFNTILAPAGTGVTFEKLTLTGGSSAASGGAVFATGQTLSFTDCNITGNTSAANGGAIAFGASPFALLALLRCNVTGNSAGPSLGNGGGAVYFFNGGAFSIVESTFSGNKAGGVGGALDFFGATTFPSVVRSSTLANNVAGGGGGGIGLQAFSGTVSVENCTITGNGATAGNGGGIGVTLGGGTIVLDNSIVSGNVAVSASDIFSSGQVNQKWSAVGSKTGFTPTDQGGNLAFGVNLLLGKLGSYGGPTQTVPLLPGSPAINAGSSAFAADQRGKSRVGFSDLGAFESLGFSVSTTTGSGQSTPVNTPFANPIGVGVTALNPGEPVDGGVVTFTVPSSGASASLSSGTATIAGGVAQVGATANAIKGTYNVVASATGSASANLTLTNTEAASLIVNLTTDVVDAFDDKTSLREAIAFANSKPGADTVTFDATVFAPAQTITLTAGELGISDAVTITGTGAKSLAVNGNNASRVFQIDIPGAGGAVAMSGLTVTGGSASGGGGIVLRDDALTLVNCAVVGNTSNSDGGGIHVIAGGSLTVRDSAFYGNTANWGGAIDFFSFGGSLLVENSTISGNSATQFGGGIYFRGDLGTGVLIRNSTVTANTAASGGGIFRSDLSTPGVTLESSIVSGNTGGSVPDVYCIVPVTANFSAVGSSSGFPSLSGANNLPFGTDLKLGPLADNGGPTLTHLPASDSPLVGKGANPAALTLDQRGLNRSVGVIDIGSVEVQTPPAKVTGVEVNGGAVQRSIVTTMKVTFDSTVTLPSNPADAFQLKRNSDSAVVNLAAVQSGADVTLTFTGGAVNGKSLQDGAYTLTVLAAQVNAGNLDGNGDGTAGDNFATPASGPGRMHRLFGDADGDADVDAQDYGAFRGAFGAANAVFDFDFDGDVDAQDFGQFRQRFGTSV